MSLQSIDKRSFGAIVIDAWQQHLGTEMDPADGQWFSNGPDNNGGLYGHVTDKVRDELVFDSSQHDATLNKVTGMTGIADNRNGLQPKQVVSLAHTYQDTITTTHASTHTVKFGTKVSWKGKMSLLVAEAELTVEISGEYSFSWTDTVSVSQSKTQTFSQQIPVDIPAGKVYQVILLVDVQEIKIPFYADLVISGQSTTNFRAPVNGQKVWTADAGTLCDWISRFGSAGLDSPHFTSDPNDRSRGLMRTRGVLNVQRSVNFTAVTKDITGKFKNEDPPPLPATLNGAQLADATDVVGVRSLV